MGKQYLGTLFVLQRKAHIFSSSPWCQLSWRMSDIGSVGSAYIVILSIPNHKPEMIEIKCCSEEGRFTLPARWMSIMSLQITLLSGKKIQIQIKNELFQCLWKT